MHTIRLPSTRPEVRFDSFEAHFPVSVDFFVRNSAVDILHIRDENFEILPKGKRLREQIRPAGTCSLEDLVNLEVRESVDDQHFYKYSIVAYIF